MGTGAAAWGGSDPNRGNERMYNSVRQRFNALRGFQRDQLAAYLGGRAVQPRGSAQSAAGQYRSSQSGGPTTSGGRTGSRQQAVPIPDFRSYLQGGGPDHLSGDLVNRGQNQPTTPIPNYQGQADPYNFLAFGQMLAAAQQGNLQGSTDGDRQNTYASQALADRMRSMYAALQRNVPRKPVRDAGHKELTPSGLRR